MDRIKPPYPPPPDEPFNWWMLGVTGLICAGAWIYLLSLWFG